MSEDKRRDLRDMLDEMDKYFEDFEKDLEEAVKNSIFSGRGDSRPFVAGFSFNLGPQGKPSVQIFGDNPARRDGFRSPISEQIVDDKNSTLRLLLEMPGVEKQDIKIETTDETAVITAEKDSKKYRAQVNLNSEVEPDSGKAEYKNGILESSFSLKDKANKGFRRVYIV